MVSDIDGDRVTDKTPSVLLLSANALPDRLKTGGGDLHGVVGVVLDPVAVGDNGILLFG
jgi:hypothetical protein